MKLKRAATGLRKLRTSRGGWAIEATGALSLLVMLIGFGMYNENRSNNQRMAEIAATHHKTVANAASAYIRDHYSALLAAVPNVDSTTKVDFATLVNEEYVSRTLSPNNPWGQTMTLRVRRSSTDPNKVQLEGLVLGEGGTAVPHELAREVSQYIGAEGSYTVASGDYCGTEKVIANTLCGTRGVWSRPIANFGAPTAPGHIASALFFKDGMVVNDYLYRKHVPGKPELNTMETYLQMGTAARAVEERPCYSVTDDPSSLLLNNGAIATNADGLILSCQSGIWKSQSMKLVGKDVQQGAVPNIMTYKGTGVDNLALYCRTYNLNIKSNSLLVLNLQTEAKSQVANYSEVVASFYIQGQLIARNYQVATTQGGFTTSVSASETSQPGETTVEICVESRSVTDWTARYSLSILE